MPLEDKVCKNIRSSSVLLATLHKKIRNTNSQKMLGFQYHKPNNGIDKREDRSWYNNSRRCQYLSLLNRKAIWKNITKESRELNCILG